MPFTSRELVEHLRQTLPGSYYVPSMYEVVTVGEIKYGSFIERLIIEMAEKTIQYIEEK